MDVIRDLESQGIRGMAVSRLATESVLSNRTVVVLAGVEKGESLWIALQPVLYATKR